MFRDTSFLIYNNLDTSGANYCYNLEAIEQNVFISPSTSTALTRSLRTQAL